MKELEAQMVIMTSVYIKLDDLFPHLPSETMNLDEVVCLIQPFSAASGIVHGCLSCLPTTRL